MASGCDFSCNNEKCEHYRKGVTVLAPWPLGEIEKVMELQHVKKSKELYNDFKKAKEAGRKYACINYPNTRHIPTVGYRINLWCQCCNMIFSYDVLLSDTVISPDSALNSPIVSRKCPQCSRKLKNLMDLLNEDDGMYCPHCKTKMKKNTWFSNETTEEIS